MLRAAFMGSPDFAVPSLLAVSRACELAVVACQPDRPAGRGRKLTPPAVKVVAQELGVPILQPRKMKDGMLAAALRQHDLDLCVVAAFGRILPPEILELPRYGCINVHGSVLPRWRGAAPIQRAVLAGDTETGVSIMQMDAGLDTGPVFTIATTPIGPHETSGALFERVATLGAETLEVFLQDFPDVPGPTPQDEDAATYAPPLKKEEGAVDWNRPCQAIVNHIRGMDPWPGAFARRGDAVLKLFGAAAATTRGDRVTPGTVIGLDGEAIRVAGLDGAITIDDVQPPGKRRMTAKAYASGRPFAPGERLS